MKDGEKSLARVFEILEAVGRSRCGLRGPEVAAALGVPVSTVFRMLKFLTDRGYLRKKETRYTLGPGLMRLGSVARGQNPLAQLARPLLTELSEETGETVHLAELRGSEVVYIDKVEGSRPVRMGSMIGRSSPCYCTGVGKALLAFQPAARREKLVAETVFDRFTPHTIGNGAALRRELEAVRSRGYAVDDGEHEPGVFCVAAPVLDASGEAVAGISVSGSEIYLRERVAAVATRVVSAARRLSEELG